MGQPIGILRHSEEVDSLINPTIDCPIDEFYAQEEDEEDLPSPMTPEISDDEVENFEFETRGNYALEAVKDIYHAGMRIYRMKFRSNSTQ